LYVSDSCTRRRGSGLRERLASLALPDLDVALEAGSSRDCRLNGVGNIA